MLVIQPETGQLQAYLMPEITNLLDCIDVLGVYINQARRYGLTKR